MNYTKEERTNIANAFKAAHLYLKDKHGDGKTNYICNALQDSGIDYCMTAQHIVRSRIAPHSTVLNWLDEQVGGVAEHSGHPKVQAHRHAWLDMLIEEFSV